MIYSFEKLPELRACREPSDDDDAKCLTITSPGGLPLLTDSPPVKSATCCSVAVTCSMHALPMLQH